MRQFVTIYQKSTVVQLQKDLYGTKQAAHACQQYVRGRFKSIGEVQHLDEECVFTFCEGDAWVIASAHVDEFLTLANDAGIILRTMIKAKLLHYITFDRAEYGVLKSTYSKSLLADFQLSVSRGIDTLMYPNLKIEECDLP